MTAVAAGTTSQHKMPQVDARSTFGWKKHKHHQILNYINIQFISVYIHMILPVPSASLSISSHSMTCKLQNSVPSLATESGTSVWRQKSRLPRSFTSSRPGIAVAKEKNLASQTFAIFDHFFWPCKHHHRHPMARCKANFSKELRSLNDMPSMMQLPRALFFAKEWRGSPRVFQPQWLGGSGRHNPAHCKYHEME